MCEEKVGEVWWGNCDCVVFGIWVVVVLRMVGFGLGWLLVWGIDEFWG